MTETSSRPSGPRFTEFVVLVFVFGLATLGAAARLLAGQDGWSSRYDETLILTVSSVFWAVGILDVLSGVLLLARRRLGWAWVAVAASSVPSLGSLFVTVLDVIEGGLGGEWIQIGFYILPFPVLLCSLLSLRRNRRIPGARGAAISAVILVAAIVAGYFGLSRKTYDNYSCRDCGAYREVRKRLEPYFRTTITLYEDTVYPTPLSQLIERHQLLPTPHEHRWLPGRTPNSFGGGAGWKEEAEDPRVVTFIDDLFRYRGPAKAVWGIRLALKIQDYFAAPLSKVLEQDSYPKSGFPGKEDFDVWMAAYELQLEKQIAKNRLQRSDPAQADPVKALFLKALNAKGFKIISMIDDSRFIVQAGDIQLTVSLENVRRQYERDHDEMAIERFVETFSKLVFEPPSWAIAKARLRFSAEPSDHDFGDTVRQPVSDLVYRVLTYATEDERTITWVSRAQLKKWGVPVEQAEAAAAQNMADLLKATKIQTEKIDNVTLALFATNSSFKASLVFSPNFRETLEPIIGWPVLVVIPCRDFMYVLAEADQALLPRMGRVVVDEYKKSGYPITPEVLRISDQGIRAIGSFPTK